jgi:hypothetical protein
VRGDSEFQKFIRPEKKKVLHAIGMESAVVDLVVIQWIVQKTKRDLKRRGYKYRQFMQYGGDQAQSA